MYTIEIVNRDGDWIRTEEFDELSDLISRWEWASPAFHSAVDNDGNPLEWEVWSGSRG